MKNLIVFLLLLGNIGVVGAQYTISITPPPSISFPHPYTCKILNSSTWSDKDLITWIFPDGQYQQKEIRANSQGDVDTGTDLLQWSPYTSTGLGNILTYVAKKGGTGTPPPLTIPLITTPCPPLQTSSTPVPIDFSPGKNWKINNLWDFSPVGTTFLAVSYKGVCTSSSSNYIDLIYNPDDIIIVNFLPFNLETMDGPVDIINSPLKSRKIHLSNITNGNYNNVFIEVKPTSQTIVGKTIQITAIGQDCLSPNQKRETEQLQYIVRGGPHDPNSK